VLWGRGGLNYAGGLCKWVVAHWRDPLALYLGKCHVADWFVFTAAI